MLAFLNGTSTKPPVLLAVRSSKVFIVTTVAAAIFTDIFLYGVVVPVLPFALYSRAGVAEDNTQTWVSILLAVYGAALLAASPVCGWFADRTQSRRAPLLAGLLALAGATVMLMVGNSIAVLVVARLLQGLSAAIVWTVGLALLVDTVGSHGIGECMGYVGLSMSGAVLIAPLLGGVVYDKAGYYAVFAMCFALLGMDVVLRLALIEKKVARKWLTEDEGEHAMNEHEGDTVKQEWAVETGAMDVTISQEQQQQETNPAGQQAPTPNQKPTNQDADTPANTDTTGSHPKEYTRLPPMLRLLASRRLLTALLGCLMQATLLSSFDSTLPLYVRSIFSWTSVGAGLIFLPIVLPAFLGPFIGQLSDKYGARWLSVLGFITACPVLILLRLVTYNSIRQKVLLCALLCLLGFTLDLVLTPLMAEITYATQDAVDKRPPGFYGKSGAFASAYGLFNMAYAGGCLLGPIVGGLVRQRAGWGSTMLVLGCLSAATAVPTAVWTGGSVRKKGWGLQGKESSKDQENGEGRSEDTQDRDDSRQGKGT